MANSTQSKGNARRTLGLVVLVTTLATPLAGHGETLKVTLLPTGADADAAAAAKLQIRTRGAALSGKLTVRVRRLAARTAYQVTIDGVRIGSLLTSRSGAGRAHFRTNPVRRQQLLGVDPRGRTIAIVDDGGAVLLTATAGRGSLDPTHVRCCLPDDPAPHCENRTGAECAAEGGIDLGAGSCLPNPCGGTTPASGDPDVVCCLPADSGPKCEARTAATCSALAGITVRAPSCLPSPCV
jgi:hypothetical protein